VLFYQVLQPLQSHKICPQTTNAFQQWCQASDQAYYILWYPLLSTLIVIAVLSSWIVLFHSRANGHWQCTIPFHWFVIFVLSCFSISLTWTALPSSCLCKSNNYPRHSICTSIPMQSSNTTHDPFLVSDFQVPKTLKIPFKSLLKVTQLF
jgi:hypothetical protein